MAKVDFTITNVGNLSTHTGGTITGVSGDGLIVVGYDNDGAGKNHPIRQRGQIDASGQWSTLGSLTDLGMLTGGTHNGANGISLDGQTIVGAGDDANSGTNNRPWFWTPTGGFTILSAVLSGGSLYGNIATGANANGTIILGNSGATGPVTEGAFWTTGSPQPITGLGNVTAYQRHPGDTPSASFGNTTAWGCSADGLTIVGNVSGQISGPASPSDPVYIWNNGTMTFLPFASENWNRMSIDNRGISADGSTVVGQAIDNLGKAHAFRWTAATGTVDIPNTLGGTNAQANECSGDGSIVVGSADDANGVFHGFWWRADVGMLQLPDIAGGSSAEAFCCSTNGRVIGGTAKDGSNVISAVVWSVIERNGSVKLPPAVAPFDPPAVDYLVMVTEGQSADPYWLERLTSTFDTNGTLASAWFLDGAVEATAVVDQGTGVKLYGLWHLKRNVGVTAYVAGLDCGDYTIASDGTLIVPYGSDPNGAFTQNAFWGSNRRALVGYTYASRGQVLRPLLPPDAGSANGPALGKTRRVHMYSLLAVNCVGVSVGTSFARLMAVQFKTPAGVTYTNSQMFSGVHWDTLDDTYSFDSMLCWQISRPYPATISSVGVFIQTQDR